MKKENYLLIIPISILIFTLAACNAKPVEIESNRLSVNPVIITQLEPQKQFGNPVNGPVEPQSYLYFNGLGFNSVSDDTEEKVAIYGLKNLAVQDKINKKISDTIEMMKEQELPPYRGVSTLILPHSELKEVYVYATVNFNAANILSVTVNKSMTISPCKDEAHSLISDSIPLNFNIKTGELIPISDLFADNSDYKEEINQYLSDRILQNKIEMGGNDVVSDPNYYTSDLYLLSPFEGIEDSQKYYISSQGDIVLLIDYEMPEFHTRYTATYLYLTDTLSKYNMDSALFSRFETWDDSLYDLSVPRDKKLRYFHVQEKRFMKDMSGTDINGEGGIGSLLIHGTIPDSIQSPTLAEKFNNKYNALEEDAKNYFIINQPVTPKDNFYVYYRYNILKIGKYYVENTYKSIGDSDDNFNTETKIYNSITGDETLLQDCFVSGYDYRSNLLEIMKANDSQLTSDEELLALIDGGVFGFGENYFNIDHHFIEFNSIGIENLTLFD